MPLPGVPLPTHARLRSEPVPTTIADPFVPLYTHPVLAPDGPRPHSRQLSALPDRLRSYGSTARAPGASVSLSHTHAQNLGCHAGIMRDSWRLDEKESRSRSLSASAGVVTSSDAIMKPSRTAASMDRGAVFRASADSTASEQRGVLEDAAQASDISVTPGARDNARPEETHQHSEKTQFDVPSLLARRQQRHQQQQQQHHHHHHHHHHNQISDPPKPQTPPISFPAHLAATKAPPTQLQAQSPCLVHQQFDDAVNVDAVLDEIAADESLSHSRLMATTTGVREISRQLLRRPIRVEARSVMIVTKARDNGLVLLTRELAEWLMRTPRYGRDVGVNVYVDAKLRHSRRFDVAGLIARDRRCAEMLRYWTPDLCWAAPERFDLVLTLGGDGTVLFTSWLFQNVVPPVLAFSLGSLGFLTHFEFANYQDTLNRVLGDPGMRVNFRMRFTCTVFRAPRLPRTRQAAAAAAVAPRDPRQVQESERFEVVNELVIDRGPSPYVSNLELYGDDELLTIIQADGCIISTPTGSTAYSLSAGGSLIHPSIPAILLTPICPHTLSFRPMVLSDTLSLRIAVPAQSRSTAYCAFDGKGRLELQPGDYVIVEASRFPFPTVVSGSGEWFDSVRRALRWNTRGAVQRGWKAGAGGVDAVDDLDSHMDGPGFDGDEEPEEEWDIDTEPYLPEDGGLPEAEDGWADSGIGPSEDGECGAPGSGNGSPHSVSGSGSGPASVDVARRPSALRHL